MYYLYTLEDCKGCENARSILNDRGIEYTELKIDNPIAEIGTRYLFKDRIYAPFLFHYKEGLYIFNDSELLKVKL